MKKSIILLTILLVQSIFIQAQLKYGVQLHGSLNTATFKSEFDLSPEKDWKFGYGGGLYAEIPISGSFSLQPSINYLKKGVKAKEEFLIEGGNTITNSIRMSLNYIEIPVLITYNLEGTSNKWFIGVGPSFGYGISGKAEVFETVHIFPEIETGFYEAKVFKDIEDDGLGFKRFDFGINAVIGMRVLEEGRVQLGYLQGLSNIANRTDSLGNKYQNRSILLTLGYKLN